MTSKTASLFKSKCYLSKKGMVQYKNKERFQVTIHTHEGVETFRVAAKAKDPVIYRQLQQLDLYAEEFKRLASHIIVTSHVDLRKAAEKILEMKKM